jgi:hypothetical protein
MLLDREFKNYSAFFQNSILATGGGRKIFMEPLYSYVRTRGADCLKSDHLCAGNPLHAGVKWVAVASSWTPPESPRITLDGEKHISTLTTFF